MAPSKLEVYFSRYPVLSLRSFMFHKTLGSTCTSTKLFCFVIGDLCSSSRNHDFSFGLCCVFFTSILLCASLSCRWASRAVECNSQCVLLMILEAASPRSGLSTFRVWGSQTFKDSVHPHGKGRRGCSPQLFFSGYWPSWEFTPWVTYWRPFNMMLRSFSW